MCGLPGCSKPCYVEHGRIHDYCGRTHATEHAAMMDAVVASKKSKGKGSGSKTKGLQPQSHFQFTSQTPHGGYFAASGETISNAHLRRGVILVFPVALETHYPTSKSSMWEQ